MGKTDIGDWPVQYIRHLLLCVPRGPVYHHAALGTADTFSRHSENQHISAYLRTRFSMRQVLLGRRVRCGGRHPRGELLLGRG